MRPIVCQEGIRVKVPFRHQVSDYDCAPTALLNALSFLFKRREIPPFVVHQIFKDCLDAEHARGTTSRTIEDLGYWLSNYRDKSYKSFAVDARYLYGDKVHVRHDSKIIRCIKAQGVAFMCVQMSRYNWHYIVGLSIEGDWLYCHDPYTRTKRFFDHDAIELVAHNARQAPNIRIHRNWLDRSFNSTKSSSSKYIFGNQEDRVCLLLNRISA